MSSTLILTGQKDEIKKSDKEILSGYWVNFNNYSQNNQNIVKYHWSDYKKVEKDYGYLKELYFKIIKSLANYLNNYHKDNKPEKYWEIIAAPWVVDIISMLWDRWEIINQCLREDIDNIFISKDYTEEFIDSDYMDLMISRVSKDDHKWNHMIFSEILKFIKPRNINLSEISINPVKKNFILNSHLQKRKINYIQKFLNNIFRNRKILFYANQLTLKNKILFSWYSKSPVIPVPDFDITLNLDSKIERDNSSHLDFKYNNNFEKFLSKFLIKIIPLSYLEAYKKILKKTKDINLNPEIIFSHYGQISNDLFKIWLANMQLKKKKIIVCYHGGSLEKYAYLNYYENICDLLLSRYKFQSKKILQLPPSFLPDKKKFLKKTNNKNLLFLTHNQMIYAYRIHDGPLSTEMMNYYSFFKDFLIKLNPLIFQNLLVRGNPKRDNLDLKNKFKIDIPNLKFSKKKNFSKDLELSKLIINTAAESTFFQSMRSGKPTLLILHKDLWNFTPEVKKMYFDLKKNNIIFTDKEKALNHIQDIWKEPLEWWNSNNVKAARNFFEETCSIPNKNNWKFFFKDIRKKYLN